ncbi:LexA family protein [Sphingomonas sp. XXL09]|uniref:LexA family protein n=1 Tax=Sphingomonas sp. XXL09 TaxID=3457787 RepID=UPI00406BCE11
MGVSWMGVQTAVVAIPRRYEALAYIIERIVQTGISPSYDEIADRLGVRKTRARELVDQLIAEGLVERPLGKQRSFRVRDVSGSRNILVEVLNRLGWTDAVPLGELEQPRTHERLSMLPPFAHLPSVD